MREDLRISSGQTSARPYAQPLDVAVKTLAARRRIQLGARRGRRSRLGVGRHAGEERSRMCQVKRFRACRARLGGLSEIVGQLAPFVEGEALACLDFFEDRPQVRVAGVESVTREPAR